ncbi:MAG: PIN/TRAM domain-containing protein [Candidatus Brocadiia bacterium]
MNNRGEQIAVYVFRLLFFIAVSAIGYTAGYRLGEPLWLLCGGIMAGALIIGLEWFVSRKPLTAISSVVFGVLVGVLLAMLGVRVVQLAVGPEAMSPQDENDLIMALGAIFVYLAVSIFYQTRDKWRVVIPYVEFRREERGSRPVFLDTSVIVDGRVADVLNTNVILDPIVIPRMVLQELQNIADSDRKIRRERGRFGLSMLDEIQHNEVLDVRIERLESDPDKPVDERLVDVAEQHNGRIMTNDYNLNRVATIEGVDIINLNELANALKPVVLPEETLQVRLIRAGEQPGQAVGYLEDGTMVVVEDATEAIGQKRDVVVTNTITRDSGRMIFARLKKQDQSRQSSPSHGARGASSGSSRSRSSKSSESARRSGSSSSSSEGTGESDKSESSSERKRPRKPRIDGPGRRPR